MFHGYSLSRFLLMIAILSLGSPCRGALVVGQGHDLLGTVASQYNFGGAGGLGIVHFVGVPIGTFDFGSGAVNVGSTDTILKRNSIVNLPDPTPPILASQTIPIEIKALSLRSATPLNWSGFGGIAGEFVRTILVADTGSSMKIYNGPLDTTPNPDVIGQFDSTLNFDILLQGMTSGASAPFSLTFTQTGGLWTREPPGPSAVLIDGVNHKLNGIDTSTDFFTGFAHHISGPHFHDTIDISAVPEPGSLSLIVLGLSVTGLALGRRKRPQ